jgi:hypothetical protein
MGLDGVTSARTAPALLGLCGSCCFTEAADETLRADDMERSDAMEAGPPPLPTEGAVLTPERLRAEVEGLHADVSCKAHDGSA